MGFNNTFIFPTDTVENGGIKRERFTFVIRGENKKVVMTVGCQMTA